MAPISDRTTVPLPWLIAGISITFSTAVTLAMAYSNITTRLDQLQSQLTEVRASQWSTPNMELWIEKAKQRPHERLPSTVEVRP